MFECKELLNDIKDINLYNRTMGNLKDIKNIVDNCYILKDLTYKVDYVDYVENEYITFYFDNVLCRVYLVENNKLILDSVFELYDEEENYWGDYIMQEKKSVVKGSEII